MGTIYSVREEGSIQAFMKDPAGVGVGEDFRHFVKAI